jgi:hypothetical protein
MVPAAGASIAVMNAAGASAATGGATTYTGASLTGKPDLTRMISDLVQLDQGKTVATDLLSKSRIGGICRDLGFGSVNWATSLTGQLTTTTSQGPSVVAAAQATSLLAALVTMIESGIFVRKDGTSFDATVLNDVLPAGNTFHGKPCLGHLLDFQYGLAVELEHGRTLGPNATNNNPVLTALIVTAHLLEDSLYYARLWVMEVDGEIFNGQLKKIAAADLTALQAERTQAVAYLNSRIAEKKRLAGI